MIETKKIEYPDGMESPVMEEGGGVQSERVMDLLDQLTPEQVEEFLRTWTASDVGGALDTMASTGLQEGQGITTPGKYGVYVANPGAFGAGVKRGVGSTGKLLEALRNRKAVQGLKGAFGNKKVNPLEYAP